MSDATDEIGTLRNSWRNVRTYSLGWGVEWHYPSISSIAPSFVATPRAHARDQSFCQCWWARVFRGKLENWGPVRCSSSPLL